MAHIHYGRSRRDVPILHTYAHTRTHINAGSSLLLGRYKKLRVGDRGLERTDDVMYDNSATLVNCFFSLIKLLYLKYELSIVKSINLIQLSYSQSPNLELYIDSHRHTHIHTHIHTHTRVNPHDIPHTS